MTDSSTLTDTEIEAREPQATAAVRIQQPMTELDLAKAFDRFMPLVASTIGARGGEIGGPPFGRYHRFGPDVVDVEIGFPGGQSPGPAALDIRRTRRGRDLRAPGRPGRADCPSGPVRRLVGDVRRPA